MHKWYLIITLCFFSCFNQNITEELTDEEFYKSIPEDNYRDTIKKIDSLFEHGEYSDYKRGLLFLEKGRMLQLFEKDKEAIISLKKALYLFNKRNKRKIGVTYMLLGTSYNYISQKDIAALYTQKALNLYKEIGFKKGEAKALNSLGHLAYLDNDFKTSVIYVKKAIEIQIEINDKNELISSYNNIGYVLEQTKEYEESIKYYQKSVDLNNDTCDLKSGALRNLGYIYLHVKNDTQKSKEIYETALIIEEQTELHVHQKEIYGGLIEIAIKEKDYSSLPLLISKKDSVSNLLAISESKEKIELLNSKHKEFVTREKLKKQLELNKKNKFILISILSLLIVLSLYIIQKNRNSNLLLKQEALELEQKMLRIQMNPHFIFNTLTAIQNKVFDNDPLKQISFISKFAKLIRQNFDFVNQKEITLTEDIDALINYIKTQQLSFNDKFVYAINIDKNIDTGEIKIPPMLLQIFVENAIEHGLKSKTQQGTLTININKEKNFIKFEIIDNGVGYTKQETPEEHAINIFKKRLKLRKLGEEKLFSVQSLGKNLGTKVSLSLNLES